MNCREFLNEFEERAALTQSATLHLNDCPDCRKTSGNQSRVWQMIDELHQVGAPNNFDFRVKARIANARPSDFQRSFLPALRYILPLSFVVLLLGVFIFKATDFSGSSTAPQIAESVNKTVITEESLPAATSPTSSVAFGEPKDQSAPAAFPTANAKQPKISQNTRTLEARLKSDPQIKTPKANIEKDSGGGNHVIGFTNPKIFLPKDINPAQPSELPPNLKNAKTSGDEQVLSYIGIETVVENSKRTVKSVTKNSIAERSGVKVGDVIEQLDGRKISDDSLPPKTVEPKSLTVLRGAEKVEITLKN